MKKKIIIAVSILFVLILAGLFYFRWEAYYSHGSNKESQVFSIQEGDGASSIAGKLKQEKLISCEICFKYYAWSKGVKSNIFPGEYDLSGNLTIPEIMAVITTKQDKKVVITFPEGWDSKKMATRLTEKGLDGDGFLQLVQNPGEFINDFSMFKDKKVKTLEGYLFPDTYFFSKDAEAKDIVIRMLGNFGEKLTPEMRAEIVRQGKSIDEIVTMASVLEKEVRTKQDKKIASGIFWKRVETGGKLQSCATLAFVLGVNKKQYSYADTQIVSPFNTYANAGLPPGPISNPGLDSIEASIYPTKTDYNFFLSDPETGKTIFSKTGVEHNANKARYGL